MKIDYKVLEECLYSGFSIHQVSKIKRILDIFRDIDRYYDPSDESYNSIGPNCNYSILQARKGLAQFRAKKTLYEHPDLVNNAEIQPREKAIVFVPYNVWRERDSLRSLFKPEVRMGIVIKLHESIMLLDNVRVQDISGNYIPGTVMYLQTMIQKCLHSTERREIPMYFYTDERPYKGKFWNLFDVYPEVDEFDVSLTDASRHVRKCVEYYLSHIPEKEYALAHPVGMPLMGFDPKRHHLNISVTFTSGVIPKIYQQLRLKYNENGTNSQKFNMRVSSDQAALYNTVEYSPTAPTHYIYFPFWENYYSRIFTPLDAQELLTHLTNSCVSWVSFMLGVKSSIHFKAKLQGVSSI